MLVLMTYTEQNDVFSRHSIIFYHLCNKLRLSGKILNLMNANQKSPSD